MSTVHRRTVNRTRQTPSGEEEPISRGQLPSPIPFNRNASSSPNSAGLRRRPPSPHRAQLAAIEEEERGGGSPRDIDSGGHPITRKSRPRELATTRELTEVSLGGTFVASDTIVSAAPSEQGDAVFTVEMGGWLRKRNAVTGALEAQQRIQGSQEPTCMTLHEDRLWVGMASGLICVYRAADQRRMADCVLHEESITALAAHSGAMLSAGSDGRVALWSLDTMECTSFIIACRISAVNCLASAGSLGFCTNGDHSTVLLWGVDPQTPSKTFIGHSGDVLALAVVESSTLWSASEDCSIHLWSLVTGQPLRSLAFHTQPVHSLMHNEGEDKIWSASMDGVVAFWDVATCERIGVLPLSYPPRGSEKHFIFTMTPVARALVWRLWTCGTDGSVRTWLSQSSCPPDIGTGRFPHREVEKLAIEADTLRRDLSRLSAENVTLRNQSRSSIKEDHLQHFLAEKKKEHDAVMAIQYSVSSLVEEEADYRLALVRTAFSCLLDDAILCLSSVVYEHHRAILRSHSRLDPQLAASNRALQERDREIESLRMTVEYLRAEQHKLQNTLLVKETELDRKDTSLAALELDNRTLSFELDHHHAISVVAAPVAADTGISYSSLSSSIARRSPQRRPSPSVSYRRSPDAAAPESIHAAVRVEVLQGKLSHLEQRQQQLESSNRLLNDRNEELVAKVTAAEHERRRSEDQLRETELKLEDSLTHLAEVGTVRGRVDHLEEMLQQAEADKTLLRERKDEMLAKLAAAESQKSHAEAQLRDTGLKLDDSLSRIELLSEKYDELHESVGGDVAAKLDDYRSIKKVLAVAEGGDGSSGGTFSEQSVLELALERSKKDLVVEMKNHENTRVSLQKRIKELTEEQSEMENKLSSSKRKEESLERRLNEEASLRDELREHLRHSNEEVEVLTRSATDLRRESKRKDEVFLRAKDEHDAEVQSLQRQRVPRAELEKEVQERNRLNTDLQQRLDNATASEVELKRQKKEIEERLQVQEVELQDAKESLSSMRVRMSDCEAQLEQRSHEARKQQLTLGSACEDAEKTAQSLRIEVNDKAKELSSTKDLLRSAENRVTQLTLKVQQLESAAMDTAEEHRREMANVSHTAEALKVENTTMSGELKARISDNERLRNDLDEERAAASQRVGGARKQAEAEHQQRLTQVQEKYSAQSHELSQSTERLVSLETEVQALQRRHQAQSQLSSSLESRLEEERKDNYALRQRVSELDSELKRSRSAMGHLEERLQGEKEAAQEQQRMLGELTAANQDSARKVREVSMTRDEVADRASTVEAEAQKLRLENETLRTNLQSVRHQLQEAELKTGKAREQEEDDLIKRLHQLTEERDRLRLEQDKLQRSVATLKKDLDNSNKNVSELHTTIKKQQAELKKENDSLKETLEQEQEQHRLHKRASVAAQDRADEAERRLRALDTNGLNRQSEAVGALEKRLQLTAAELTEVKQHVSEQRERNLRLEKDNRRKDIRYEELLHDNQQALQSEVENHKASAEAEKSRADQLAVSLEEQKKYTEVLRTELEAEVLLLKDRLVAATNESETAQKEKSRTERRLRELEADADTHSSSVSGQLKANKRLEEENRTLSDELHVLKQKHNTLSSTITSLGKDFEAADSESTQLRAKVSSLTQEREELSGQLERTKRQLSENTRKLEENRNLLDDTKDQHGQLRTAFQMVEDEAEQLRRELSLASKRSEVVSSEKKEAEEKLAKVEAELSQLTKRIEQDETDVTASVRKAKREADVAVTAHTLLKEDIQFKQKRIEALETEVKDHAAEVNKLEKVLTEERATQSQHEERVVALLTDIEHVSRVHESTSTRQQERIADLERQLERKNDESSTLRRTKASESERAEIAERGLLKIHEDTVGDELLIVDLQAELDAANSELKQKKEELENSLREIVDLDVAGTEEKQRAAVLEQEKVILQRKLETASIEVRATREQNEELSRENEKVATGFASMRLQFEEENSEGRKLKIQVGQLTGELEHLRNTRKEDQEEIRSLQRQLDAAERQNHSVLHVARELDRDFLSPEARYSSAPAGSTVSPARLDETSATVRRAMELLTVGESNRAHLLLSEALDRLKMR